MGTSCDSKAKNNDPKSAILNLAGKCARVGMERDSSSQVENYAPFDIRTFRSKILVEWNAPYISLIPIRSRFRI